MVQLYDRRRSIVHPYNTPQGCKQNVQSFENAQLHPGSYIEEHSGGPAVVVHAPLEIGYVVV